MYCTVWNSLTTCYWKHINVRTEKDSIHHHVRHQHVSVCSLATWMSNFWSIHLRYLLPTSLISMKIFTQLASLKLHSKMNHVLIPGYDPFWENPARWEPCTPENYVHIHHHLVYLQVSFSFTFAFYDGDTQGRHGLPLWTADQDLWYYH